MPDIEQQLRRHLTHEAERFTPSPGFEAQVRSTIAGSRRSGFRIGLLVAAVLVLAGLAAVVLPAVLDDDEGEPNERIVLEPGPSTAPSTTPSTATTSASTAPPRSVPTTEPPALNAGWRLLDPGPLSGREGFGAVWTGRELVVWGGSRVESRITNNDGAAYSQGTGRWRSLARAPIRSRVDHVTVWTGREVIVWGGRDFRGSVHDGAAYDPVANSWRLLSPAPVAGGPEKPAVWTGEEVVILGGDGAAYNPTTDQWRRLPPAPGGFDFARAVWSGREVFLVLGTRIDMQLAAYDPSSNTWRRAPDSGAPGQTVDFTWNGRELVTLAYTGPDWTTLYDPGTDSWTPGPDWPTSDCEGVPNLATIDEGRVVGTHCGAVAILDGRRWELVTPPVGGSPTLPATMLSAGATVLWYDPGIPPGTPNFGSGTPATLLEYSP